MSLFLRVSQDPAQVVFQDNDGATLILHAGHDFADQEKLLVSWSKIDEATRDAPYDGPADEAAKRAPEDASG